MKSHIALATVALILSGCASTGEKLGIVTQMKETKDGGRIMLNGTGTWMEEGSQKKADAVMTQKCANGFDIVETGQMEKPNTSGLTRAHARLEKYIEYKCRESSTSKL